MKKFLPLILILSVFPFVPAALNAQERISVKSVDPAGDSLVFAAMREKMAAVKTRRPAVALVLSGGGAKGAAHVGAIRYLEEQKIPVDMVLGTSMGGLIGALYAVGYDAPQMDSILRSINWDIALTDKVDRSLIPLEKKMYRQKFPVSVPFDFGRGKRVKFDAGDGRESNDFERAKPLVRSLPEGYAYGLNVNNIISSLTVGYQDSLSFMDLPLPYFCVAGDLVSLKAKNWSGGSLQAAMRSTMSIPGLFDPVRYGGMILVDGGVRNNFPTDLARQMGADIVIGVELGDSYMTYDDVNNFMDVANQMIDMLGRDALEANKKLADVYIKPNLREFNMLSFDDRSIDQIISRGYEAAVAEADEIDRVRELTGAEGTRRQASPAINLNGSSVRITGVEFKGLSRRESDYVSAKTRLHPGDSVNARRLDRCVGSLFGSGMFNSLTWSLKRDGEDFRVVFDCVPAPVHMIGAGVRADSEELVSGILNIGINTQKIRGLSLSMTGKLGMNSSAEAVFSFREPHLPTLNFSASISRGRINTVNSGARYYIDNRSHSEALYFSGLRHSVYDYNIGIRYCHYTTGSFMTDHGTLLRDGFSGIKDKLPAAFVNARAYTMDNRYFPRRGLDTGFEFIRSLEKDAKNILSFDYRQVFRFGPRIAVIPSFSTRNIFNANDYLCLRNFAGGTMDGRYLPHQIGWIAVNRCLSVDDHLAVADLEIRAEVMDDLFVSLHGGFIKDGETLMKQVLDTAIDKKGFALEIGYDSIAGPIKGNIHWSNVTGWGAHIGYGFDF